MLVDCIRTVTVHFVCNSDLGLFVVASFGFTTALLETMTMTCIKV